MKNAQPSQHPHGNPNSDSARGGHRPYWQRAHRDWRLWVGVLAILVAMLIYIVTEDLTWWPGR